MSERPHPRRRPLAGLGAVLVLLVAGCGDGTPDEPTPSTGASSPGVASSSPGDPGTTDASPSGVPAADGPLVDVSGFELHVPQGYQVDDSIELSISAFDAGSRDAIFIGNLEDVSESSLEDLMAESERVGLWKGRPERLEPVTLDGVQWYHLSGRGIAFPRTDEYGAWHDGTQVRLSFNSWSGRAQRERVIESVLQTFAWH